MLAHGMQNLKIFNIWGGGAAPSPDPTPRRPMAIDRNGNLLFHTLNPTGNLFQHFGPATAKDLEPHSVLCPGTTRSPRAADLKPERPTTAAVPTQRSER